MLNQFSRTELLIGKEGIEKLNKSKVAIFGIGGVGSFVVEGLVRAGVQNFILVDDDKVCLTNLNRQLMTYHSNIGNFKTDEIEKRILDINPEAHIIKITEFIDMTNINKLFNYKIDYVVDACDTLMVKLELIRICKRNNIKLISCMGTGNKMDPTKLKITDIRKTSYDPLAKKIRKMVKDEKINGKVMVVCSDEEGKVKINKEIPSNSFVPATAGLLCASYVINDIVGDLNV